MASHSNKRQKLSIDTDPIVFVDKDFTFGGSSYDVGVQDTLSNVSVQDLMESLPIKLDSFNIFSSPGFSLSSVAHPNGQKGSWCILSPRSSYVDHSFTSYA